MTNALPLPPSRAVLSTKAEADMLLLRLTETMDALVAVVGAETDLVRRGKLKDAAKLQADKAELARRYTQDMMVAQANAGILKRLSPDRLTALSRRHDGFRAELQINMTVLATAKALSEGIMQEVAEAVARQDTPVGYGRKGAVAPTTAKTARPVSLDRAL